MSSPGLTRAILALSAAQAAAGLLGFAGFALGDVELAPAPIPAWVSALSTLAFAVSSSLLIVGGRHDRRTAALGGAFMLLAAAYGYRLAQGLAESSHLELPLTVLASLQVEAFMPWFAWSFVKDFPRGVSSARLGRSIDLAVRASFALGATLALANVGLWLDQSHASPVRFFARNDPQSLFQVLVYGGTLLALPVIPWKTRTARPEERRRVALFSFGLAVGLVPAASTILAIAISPSFARWIEGPTGRNVFLPFVHAGVLAVPLLTAYSVRVDRVLGVRFVVRQALQYSLTRGTVIAASVVPLLALSAYLFWNRDRALGTLLAGPGGWVLAGGSVLALAAVQLRGRALLAIDRRFFREEYDARETLARLAGDTRHAKSDVELSRLLRLGVDRALHLDFIAVLTVDPDSETLRAPEGEVRSLPLSSAFVEQATLRGKPFELDLDSPRSPLRELPLPDQQRIVDGGFGLAVPLLTADGGLLGLMALGSKRSDLPFSREDRLLLQTIAISGGLVLESLGSDRGAPETSDSLEAAREEGAVAQLCEGCGRIAPHDAVRCGVCGGALEPAPVPEVLLGKFRFERRIGQGGMGVVFLASDTALAREVAVKTLPRLETTDALLLRREARTMAAVSHPNLASIFGAESWRGTPLLVMEYLEGGTLEERLAQGLLTHREALDLGVALASALEKIHRAGVLHRDVKPSNIGFTGDGLPKLLDFGLATIVRGSVGLVNDDRLDSTASASFVGTPLYLAPEALAGGDPEPSFDLWALAVVLFEAMTGRIPVERETAAATYDAILAADVPDLREIAPDCPRAFAACLADALSRDRGRRPATAREFHSRLLALARAAPKAAA